MDGRYAINRASTPRPNMASKNARTLVGRSPRTHETERQERRATLHEGGAPARHAQRVEHHRESAEDHREPDDRQKQQCERRVQRQDAVATLVRLAPRCDQGEDAARGQPDTLESGTTEPLGRTNVRTAASITRTTSATPAANHRIFTASIHLVSPRSRSHSPLPLEIASTPLALEPAAPPRRARRRRPTGPRGAKRVGEPLTEPGQGQLPVAGLGPRVRCDHPHHRTDPLQQPGALRR